MNDGVKKTFKDYPSPARDSNAEPTRWTRPTIRELGRVQEAESVSRTAPNKHTTAEDESNYSLLLTTS